MALIKLGPVVGDARGSVGSTVFSRNRFGAYMKQRTKPTFPNTEKQAAMTSRLSEIVSKWNTELSVAQRKEWNDAALLFTVPNALADQVHLSGMQWYMRCNMLLDITLQTLVTVPPAKAILPAPTITLAHTAGVGIEGTAIGIWDNTAVQCLRVSKSDNIQQTINYFNGPWSLTWRQLGAYYNVLPALITGIADMVINTRLFYSFRSVHSDGASSFSAIYSVDVGDPL